MIIQVWIVIAKGHRPYVTTTEPNPGYYQSMKAQGHFLYRAEVHVPDYDDGLVSQQKAERVL